MSRSNECLLNNALERNFQRMFLPYHLTQRYLLVSKYLVKDNFVTPNSKAYCAFSLILLSLLVCFYVYNMVMGFSCSISKLCPLMLNVQILLGHAVLAAVVIFQSNLSVEFLIKMQKIDSTLKLFGINDLTCFIKRNWCCVSFLYMFYGLHVFWYIVYTKSFPILRLAAYVFTMAIDLDLLYITFAVVFLLSRLGSWTNLLLDYGGKSSDDNSEYTFGEDQDASYLFQIAKNIFETYEVFRRLSQYMILCYIILTFIHSIMSVQVLIMWAKNSKEIELYYDFSFFRIAGFIWDIKNFIILTLFSITCERFYSSVENTKKACVLVLELNSNQNGSRKLAKNVIRLCAARHSELRACGLFAVGAALPLRLAGLLATYCVVLLQFAFL